MKISACLITKNEEQNIVRCIESFKDYVDEIIVVDTGSDDRTIELAEEMGAHLYSYQWDDNFANARNYAIDKAQGNWILMLDADEYFYGGTGRNIGQVVRETDHEEHIDAISCKCYDIKATGERELSSYRMRVFRNHPGLRYRWPIHEFLDKGEARIKFKYVPEDQLIVYHTGYANKLLIDLKHRRNLKILLRELDTGNAHPGSYAYLTSTYNWLQEYELAIKYARKFINSGRKMNGWNVNVRVNLINCLKKAGYSHQEVILEIKQTLIDYPDHPDLNWLLAIQLFRFKKYDEAILALEKTFHCGFNYNGVEDTSWLNYIKIAYSTMGDLYNLKNDLPQAINYYVKSLQENKWDNETLNKLIILVRKKDSKELLPLLQNIFDENSIDDIRILVTFLCKFRVKSVLGYYYDILNTKFSEENVVFLFVLLCNGEYEESYQYFIDLLKEECNYWLGLYAIISALLSKNTGFIAEVLQLVDQSFYRIVNGILNPEKKHMLTMEDYFNYKNLVKEFNYLGATEEVNTLLRLKSSFPIEISLELGEIFFSAGDYEQALKQYLESLKQERVDLKSLYFKIGKCYYIIYDYVRAKEFMEKALKSGYEENDVYAFLNWMDHI